MRILGARGALGARRTPVLLIGATVVAVLCFAGAMPADASPAAPHLARQVATASAPGDPDATFGQGGRVTTNLRFDRAIETVVQSIPLASGDVLAIVSPRLFNSFSLRRFHADGSIDVTFANGGVGGLPSLPVMAVDASGRIIVAGSTGVAPSSDVVSVRRYSASGALDQTFAGDGAAEIDRGFYEAAAALTLQSDGKPVLVVSSFSGRSLVRLDAAGVPDTSFSGDGDLPLPNGNTVGLGVRVAGQVLVASSNPGLTLHQFLSDGTPDGLFGTSGAVTVPVGSATIRRTQLPSDGRLVFAGESANDLLIGRVTKAGVLDNTFSNDGLLTTDLAPIDQLDALTVDPPGRVLVVSDDQGAGRFVSRITPGGVPDSTFGASGVQPFNGPALQQVRDIDAVPGGGILLSTSVGFAKLQATGLPNTAFGNFGVVHPGFNSPTTDFSFDTVTQPDGRIIVAGVSNDVGVVARYNANGSLDSTFGSAGLRLLTDGAGNEFVPVSLDLDATGRVVISAMGNSQWNAGGPAVLRTTFAGSLDATFGGDGIVDLPTLGSGPMAAQGDPGGGAVIAGAPSGGGTTSSVVRIAPNGAPDAGFGGTGTATVDLGAGSDSVKGVDLTSAGEVVVLGSTSDPVVVARLTAAGVPDAAFGGGAPVVVTAPAGSAVLARELIVKPDGLVAIGGEYCFQDGQFVCSDGRSFIAELTDAGTPNSAFGTDGLASFDLVPGTEYQGFEHLNGLAFDGPDNILIGASAERFFNNNSVIALAGPAGLVSSFGTNGIAPVSNLTLVGLARAGDGGIVVTGTFSFAEDITVARFLGSGTSPALTIAVGDVSMAEGNVNHPMTFTITLSQPASQAVTVNAATANDTAASQADYLPTTATITFNPNETSKSFSVPIKGDKLVEPDETFFVNLSGATGATIGDSQAIGTIVNDDSSTLSISAADISVDEGSTGHVVMFTVKLSGPSSAAVTVDFTTANGTALSGSDYRAVAGTVTFNPGKTSATVKVTVKGDATVEPNETFFLNLTNATGGAVIGDSQAQATLVNDD